LSERVRLLKRRSIDNHLLDGGPRPCRSKKQPPINGSAHLISRVPFFAPSRLLPVPEIVTTDANPVAASMVADQFAARAR